MAKVSPYLSTHPSDGVYHDNNNCVDGNNIERKYWKPGTGGRPKCHRCKGLG